MRIGRSWDSGREESCMLPELTPANARSMEMPEVLSAPVPMDSGGAALDIRGIVKWNTEPLSRAASSHKNPPIRPVSREEMERPGPVPPKRRVEELSALENASK